MEIKAQTRVCPLVQMEQPFIKERLLVYMVLSMNVKYVLSDGRFTCFWNQINGVNGFLDCFCFTMKNSAFMVILILKVECNIPIKKYIGYIF